MTLRKIAKIVLMSLLLAAGMGSYLPCSAQEAAVSVDSGGTVQTDFQDIIGDQEIISFNPGNEP